MKLAYVAGPYRADTERGLVENIRRAEGLAVRLWQAGFAVICPHLNSAHLGGVCPDRTFLDGDLEILSRCDLLVCTGNWLSSSGAQAEVGFAAARGIPICEGPVEAENWLRSQTEEAEGR